MSLEPSISTAANSAEPSLISPILPPESFKVGAHPPLQLGVMASGTGSNFVAIANAIANQTLAAQIQVLIYNNPGAKVADHSQTLGIPTRLINHREYAQRERFDQEIVTVLQEFEVDWVVMVGWMRRATAVLVDAFQDRIINIHPSLLPSFPGTHAVEQALAAGVKISGCTVHLIRLKVDSGPILVQAAVPVHSDDTPETLHARIQVQEHKMIVQAIAQLSQISQFGSEDSPPGG